MTFLHRLIESTILLDHRFGAVGATSEHPIFVPSTRSDNNYSPYNLSLVGGENVQDPNVLSTALDNPMIFIIQQEQSAYVANDEVDPPVNEDEAMRSA